MTFSNTPAKRSSSSSRNKPPKKQKQAKNQLLISRFFPSASAARSAPVPVSSPSRKAESASRPAQNPTPLSKKETELSATLPDTPEDGNCPPVAQTINSVDALNAGDASPGEVVTNCRTRQRTREENAQKRPGRPSRRRIFITDDVDDESETERIQKQVLSRPTSSSPSMSESPGHSSPEFVPSEDKDDDDDYNAHDKHDDVANDSDANGDAHLHDEGVCMGDIVNASSPLTLEAYSLNRGDGRSAPSTIPRDEKRRAKFTSKIGRLEKNDMFLRYTGGGGASSHDAAERSELSMGVNHRPRKPVTKYTPLEAQFVQLRKTNPNMLLIVECGYKYRLFDTDATAASSVLRIASYFDHNFLTASFPTHRLAHHVRRLVDAGYKVGVVSQSETAALKKASENSSKLFTRMLSAVYTKGTIAADGTLLTSGKSGSMAFSKSATYIMAVREVVEGNGEGQSAPEDKVGIAIATVDCATGRVFYDSFRDDILRSELESRLITMEPVEVLTTSTHASKRTETVLTAYCENTNARMERLLDKRFERRVEIEDMNTTVESTLTTNSLLCVAVLSCLGALFDYLKVFNLQLSMSNLADYKTFRSTQHMKIGADVLANFEVFGNSDNGGVVGSLIGLVNRTKTAFGSRMMRRWVSQPLVNARDIRDRLDAVEYLRPLLQVVTHHETSEVNACLADLITTLPDIPDLEQALMRISCGKCKPSEVLRVLKGVEMIGAVTDRIKKLVGLANRGEIPVFLEKLFERSPIVDSVLQSGVVGIFNRDAAQHDRYHEVFVVEEEGSSVNEILNGVVECSNFITCVKELEEANMELQKAESAMSSLLTRLKREFGCPKWEWKKVAQEEYLIEVSLKQAGRVPSSWTIVSQTKAVKRFRPGAAIEGYDRVLQAREARDAISSTCWKSYVELFSHVGQRLVGLVRVLSEFDCVCAFARVANLPGYCKPTVVSDDVGEGGAGILAVNGRHPLTEALPTCRSYVPNDVSLGMGECARAVVISGPNYGGKSSYARMTALLILLSQMGSYVPADSVDIRPFDALYARMGASDCMAKGMSSLMVELADTARILKAASARSCVVVDELGRGTSTHDGAAIAFAALSYFVASIRCVTLFVTHYPVIGTLETVFPRMVKACFMDYREELEESSGDGRRKAITLLYKLTRGIAPSSYGVNVARLAGIEGCVLDEALSKAKSFEAQIHINEQDNRYAALMTSGQWQSDDATIELLRHRRKTKNRSLINR